MTHVPRAPTIVRFRHHDNVHHRPPTYLFETGLEGKDWLENRAFTMIITSRWLLYTIPVILAFCWGVTILFQSWPDLLDRYRLMAV